jgi:hypothetical protein
LSNHLLHTDPPATPDHWDNMSQGIWFACYWDWSPLIHTLQILMGNLVSLASYLIPHAVYLEHPALRWCFDTSVWLYIGLWAFNINTWIFYDGIVLQVCYASLRAWSDANDSSPPFAWNLFGTSCMTYTRIHIS